MLLTKARLIKFNKCPKLLALSIKSPELKVEDSDDYLIRQRNNIDSLACQLFPGGIQVRYKSNNLSQMASKTQQLIKDGVTTIYGATFMINDFAVSVDIFHYDEGWHMYEVTYGTSIKIGKIDLDGVSFQMNIVQQVMGKTIPISLITLSRDYIKMKELSIEELFDITDVSTEAHAHQKKIFQDVVAFSRMDLNKVLSIEIGQHCIDKSSCKFKSYCWSHVPEDSVFDLKNARGKQYTLYKKGIIKLEDIPAFTKLNEKQIIQVDCYLKDKTYINREEIRKFMSGLSYPLYFLDFESINPAVPLYESTSPYDQVPFQYSLHIMKENNLNEDNLLHVEFLAEAGVSPLRAIAESLVENIPFGSMCVAYYYAYEKARLKELAFLFDDLCDHLLSISDNMVDLYKPFHKMWYYAPAMKGSASIKSVLPALFPNDVDIDYKGLTIQNGTMAMRTFETLHFKSKEDIKSIRKDLLAYCKLDTYAMVKIHEKLDLI